ncbi:hypothetical protein ACRASX_16385 (plasmid) [Flavobacterium sp. TMP13]|uniref:hypothetical protein n=1 Tax=Flavobacterium sp. TMP13 TaxID=3425950 RepID=UPI003D77A2F0
MEYFHPFSNELFERKWNAKAKKERFKGGTVILPDEEEDKQRSKDLFFKHILEIDPWTKSGGVKEIELVARFI